MIEERVESSGTISANPDRQFVWGVRYIDEFVHRDRDTDSDGTFNERLYALLDANWNIVGLIATSGAVQERYAYIAYGMPRVLTPTFATRTSSSYEMEILYAGYRHERTTGLCHVRHRAYHPALGCWGQRDPIGYADDTTLVGYSRRSPINLTDPGGLSVKRTYPCKTDVSNYVFLEYSCCGPGERALLGSLACDAFKAISRAASEVPIVAQTHGGRPNLASHREIVSRLTPHLDFWFSDPVPDPRRPAFEAPSSVTLSTLRKLSQNLATMSLRVLGRVSIQCESKCSGTKRAYVYSGFETIHICPSFYLQQPRKRRVATLIHEFAHAFLGYSNDFYVTEPLIGRDVVANYEVNGTIATIDAATAVENPPTYEWFFIDAYL